MKKTEKIKWGIIGTGGIADQFASALNHVEDAELTAVASRSLEKAEKFAESHDINNFFSPYENLAGSDKIDAIYIATPHPFHYENTLTAIKNKKNVLCEKPFAMNHRQGLEMIEKAKEKDLFIMEAMWTRFLPLIKEVKGIISSGGIGKVRSANINFNIKAPDDPKHRILNPDLGGGALLDIGVYALSMAQMIFQTKPCRIASQIIPAETGVDLQDGIILDLGQKRQAVITLSVQVDGPRDIRIYGDGGNILIGPEFYRAQRARLTNSDGRTRKLEFPFEGNGLYFQVREADRCIRKNSQESEILPHEDTLEVLKIMDKIRENWNLKYPME